MTWLERSEARKAVTSATSSRLLIDRPVAVLPGLLEDADPEVTSRKHYCRCFANSRPFTCHQCDPLIGHIPFLALLSGCYNDRLASEVPPATGKSQIRRRDSQPLDGKLYQPCPIVRAVAQELRKVYAIIRSDLLKRLTEGRCRRRRQKQYGNPAIVSEPNSRNSVVQGLLRLFEVFVVLILLIDAIARPLYRPLLTWVATLRVMHRFEVWIAALPRFVILVLFAVPFVIAEPLKVLALLLIARGLVISGVLLMAFAYLVTFLIVERIYDAGRDKLLTYGWFKWGMDRVLFVRNLLLAIRDAGMLRLKTWFRFQSRR